MRKLNLVLLAVGLGFLGYLVWTAGPRSLGQQVLDLGWGLVPLILSEGLANLAHTLGWRRCLDKDHPPVPLPRLFNIAMAGYSLNYLLPTMSVGGEASKAALVASTRPLPAALSSVVLDRLSTAIAHLLLGLLGAGFILCYARLPAEIWITMAVTTLMLSAALGAFLLLQRYGKLGALLRWLTDRRIGGNLTVRASRHVNEVDETLKRFYRERPLDLGVSISWHLLGHSAAILQVWLFLWLLHRPAPLAPVACAGFFALWCDLLTFAIPLNLGALEGSRTLALKAIGNNVAVGMAFGVSIRITQLFWACYGLISYGCLTMRKTRWPAATPPGTLPAESETGAWR
jgi:uncharacterized membrane protein YbhN (UPF0104 family)